jgi:predicted metal-dependent hydrolase
LDYATTIITPLFKKWMKKMQLDNVILNFRWMVSKYGVCSCNKPCKVTLSLESITYAKETIDYLIVHELAHVVHPHHQQKFWDYVAQYIPNWKVLDKDLKKDALEYLQID